MDEFHNFIQSWQRQARGNVQSMQKKVWNLWTDWF